MAPESPAAAGFHDHFSIPPSVHVSVSGDGGFLLHEDSGVCFSLNVLGARIWTELQRSRSAEEIVTSLTSEFPDVRSGPRNLDSGLSGISIVFQAAVPKPVVPKYTTSGVRRPSEL